MAIALEIHGSLAQSKGLWIDSWECRAVCFAPRSEIAWLFVEALYEKVGLLLFCAVIVVKIHLQMT